MTVWLWLRTWEGRNKTPQQKLGNPACIFSNAREGPKKNKNPQKMDWLQVFWNRNHCDLRTVFLPPRLRMLLNVICMAGAFNSHDSTSAWDLKNRYEAKSIKDLQFHLTRKWSWPCGLCPECNLRWKRLSRFCPLRLRNISAILVRSWEVLTGNRGCQNVVENSISHYKRNMSFYAICQCSATFLSLPNRTTVD